MELWKALVLLAPAGLALGAVGGHMARPVLAQRVSDDDPVQAMFARRADRYSSASDYPRQIEGPMDYVGGYSYAPDESARLRADWTPPDYYHFPDMPLPTIAELEARQAALLADPEKQFAVEPPSTGAYAVAGEGNADERVVQGESLLRGTAGTAGANPEPRTADGTRALW